MLYPCIHERSFPDEKDLAQGNNISLTTTHLGTELCIFLVLSQDIVMSFSPKHYAPPQSFRRAWQDVAEACSRHELWITLGWQDIKQRYRRSVLGPFWITLAAGISSLAMGFLYGMLFHIPLREFLPYVTIGIVLWNVVQGALTDGVEVFIENEGLIKQLPAPVSVHVFRLMYRHMIFLLHNFVVIVLVLAVFPSTWSWADLSFIPGIFLIIVNAFWVTLVIGTLATRFRDIVPMMTSVVQLLFFVTPIIWTQHSLLEQGSWKSKVVEINPLFHFLEIVRAPLLGQSQSLYHWLIVLAITVLGWLFALFVLRNYRNRVPYWV